MVNYAYKIIILILGTIIAIEIIAFVILTFTTIAEVIIHPTISITCSQTDVERDHKICVEGAKRWEEQSGYRVNPIPAPNDVDQRLAKYHRWLTEQHDALSESANSGMKNLKLRLVNVLFSMFCKGAALDSKTCEYFSQSMSVDVLGIDVIWPEILSRHLLDLKKYVSTEEIRQHFPLIIENNTVNGRLVAMPYFADVGLLYYRKDLLSKYEDQIVKKLVNHGRLKGKNYERLRGESYGNWHQAGNLDELVPKTWNDLAEVAKLIQDKENEENSKKRHSEESGKENDEDVKQELWGFIWQGSDSEGLTCNALEWIASQFEGSHTKIDVSDHVLNICNELEVQGQISFNSMLSKVADWIAPFGERYGKQTPGKNYISPYRVLTDGQEEIRIEFQSGHALFMRNWPFAWHLVNSPESRVQGKVGVAALPEASMLGGMQLAVSRYSVYPDQAAKLVQYLTGYKEQKHRAHQGYAPTIGELYYDEELTSTAFPNFSLLASVKETFAERNVITRPRNGYIVPYYMRSNDFRSVIHSFLDGRTISPYEMTRAMKYFFGCEQE